MVSLYLALADGPATTYTLAAAARVPRADAVRGVRDLLARGHVALLPPRRRCMRAVALTDAGRLAFAELPAGKAAP